jgi:DNA-binding response OmpR family regulator
LPDLGGEEVLRALQQQPRTQRIPVTVLSADATPGQIHRLKAAGAREYLTKPLDVRQIIQLLEDTLRREQVEEQPGEMMGTDYKPALHWTPEATNLTGLATELLQQLRSAIQDGEKDRLDELITIAANQDPQSASALKDLADKYEYDTLTNLLVEATGRAEAGR